MRKPVALLLVMGIILAACGDDGSVLARPSSATADPTVSTSIAPTTPPPPSGESFPPAVVEAYLEGCADTAEDLPYCRCTIAQFEARLTLDEFVALEDLSGGIVLDVATACLAEAGGVDSTTTAGPPLPPTDLRAYTDLTIDAVEAYWQEALPDVYGIAYEDVSATIPYFPSSGDLPECGPEALPNTA
ncbi:MAG: hypothetical protein MUP76_05145, partial [Acidimicrobiia bacterium]|nr:hypothetical protein [Acidimicrobiia bacterium]